MTDVNRRGPWDADRNPNSLIGRHLGGQFFDADPQPSVSLLELRTATQELSPADFRALHLSHCTRCFDGYLSWTTYVIVPDSGGLHAPRCA